VAFSELNEWNSYINTEAKIFFFPSEEFTELPENSRALERSRIISYLSDKKGSAIVVTSSSALKISVPKPQEVSKEKQRIETGMNIHQDFFCQFLKDAGFSERDVVEEPGTFARRGALVDVFSFASVRPLRIEWNGDIIEEIREFDPESQMSESQKQWAEIFAGTDSCQETNARLTDYFSPENDILILQDPEKFFENQENESESYTENFNKIFSNFFKVFSFGKIPEIECMDIFFQTYPQPVFGKKYELLYQFLSEKKKEGYRHFLLSSNPRQHERLLTILEDFAPQQEKTELASLIEFLPVSVREGFILTESKKIFFTDHQLFGKIYHKEIQDPLKGGRKRKLLKELSGWNPGDYVVHIDHGIGRFGGLEKIQIQGRTQEAVRLIYKNNDILYVGVHQLHKISKYTGKDGTPPSLDRLGSTSWEKTKQKIKKKIKELSYDLVRLYAQRKASSGFSFPPDNYMDLELEASFEYEDTPDQMKVTREVKKDMMSAYPMERLICGDVGFGKTEIAIRAAFKAACAGKQVAVLVPTTILAYQHYQTFSRRLKDFPCKVDFISRFKSQKEIRKTLEELREGKIEILIGTHRILSKDVVFKDLGLLIIDEEQKFGVAAKDKIKLLKNNVDTLILTATPIPRTLQHSLLGSCDLSIIQTPPPNRIPVQTQWIRNDENILEQAIRKELQRNGQIFFIHHRVQDLTELAQHWKMRIPELSVSIAHGQMKTEELEESLFRFVTGKTNILFCTTIVENGLDIPNANTMIINNAHYFGLSDLHQMRGRIGRSDKKGYCYLVVPSFQGLTAEAERRLKALVEFSDLGSGFQIAMRDMDIRGAGNLLGAEQSGFIYEMGIDTYMKILRQAMQEIKEENPQWKFSTDENTWINEDDLQLETDWEVRIPDTYIPDMQERLAFYHRLNTIQNPTEEEQIRLELKDRYGEIPEEVNTLINLIQFRKKASACGFDKVVLKNKFMRARIPGGEKRKAYFESETFTTILQYIQHHPHRCQLSQEGNFIFIKILDVPDVQEALHIISNLMPQSLQHAHEN
jgi:transcription-repair coupling factor (superfamily II helicase)